MMKVTEIRIRIRYWFFGLTLLMALCAFIALASKSNREIQSTTGHLIGDWYRHMLHAETHTEGYRGPVVARMYGYVGLAAYESAVPFLDEGYQSLSGLFGNAYSLPVPEVGPDYYLPAVLNACYAAILDSFFMTASSDISQERQVLEQQWEEKFRMEIDPDVLKNSRIFGQQVATVIYTWSSSDRLGHKAYLTNYDECYDIPPGEGHWQPCPAFPMPPLLPHWGQVRPFLISPSHYLAKPLPSFSREAGSIYHDQAIEVFNLQAQWSGENQWIAEYWSDDHPGLTFSPVGRWISIANQVVERENPSPTHLLETYLRMGLALHDAVVACWYSKYHYLLERPETFVREVIDADWAPHHHTPPFPSYPSGHSMIGMAAAEVLTSMFGDQYSMTDNSHMGRTEFKGTPRHYSSFADMARESAYSRILLGVHFRLDCEEGLSLGKLIGDEIANLPLRADQQVSFIP